MGQRPIKHLPSQKTLALFASEGCKTVTLNSMTTPYRDSNAGKKPFLINFPSIQFADGNWILKDGDGIKLSTNGTWLFVDELFRIYDQMIFKAG